MPKTDRAKLNAKSAFGAEESAQMDFSKEDAADDLVLNEIIWRNVRGAKSPMPAPIRRAWILSNDLDD